MRRDGDRGWRRSPAPAERICREPCIRPLTPCHVAQHGAHPIDRYRFVTLRRPRSCRARATAPDGTPPNGTAPNRGILSALDRPAGPQGLSAAGDGGEIDPSVPTAAMANGGGDAEANGNGAARGAGRGRSVLVTGGAGFIGTHTVLRLLEQGYGVTAVDNFHNSVPEALDRVRRIAGPALSARLHFILGDLRSVDDLEKVFAARRYDAVVHFAGLKAVGESVAHPDMYYENNLVGTINLYSAMKRHGCRRMVFSSSATVYGEPEVIPCVEDSKLQAANPYGRTKLILEDMARDYHRADPEWSIVLLRYFNPIGAHGSGEIGEDPKGVPNNLLPYIQQVAVGRLPELNIYGHDYPTRDGTAIRDYIHVVDLADGHIAALNKLFDTPDIGCVAYNLGTGRGTSVLEMVAAFEKASGKKIPIKLCPRRPGDATEVYASTDKAERELGWRARYGIEEMCRDQWNWAKKNPYGYCGSAEHK